MKNRKLRRASNRQTKLIANQMRSEMIRVIIKLIPQNMLAATIQLQKTVVLTG